MLSLYHFCIILPSFLRRQESSIIDRSYHFFLGFIFCYSDYRDDSWSRFEFVKKKKYDVNIPAIPARSFDCLTPILSAKNILSCIYSIQFLLNC
ncbi:MAG: hypothetical protein DRG83_11835 [Deltaproteobacteria bacterium]|nr:MAG: hypothetical protein DRG83_11835 [Deltaproteobacteria bacterium]